MFLKSVNVNETRFKNLAIRPILYCREQYLPPCAACSGQLGLHSNLALLGLGFTHQPTRPCRAWQVRDASSSASLMSLVNAREARCCS